MAQNLDLNINVNTDQAAQSLGSLKKQLREAQAEVSALSDKFGATSKQAIEAAKRAAELKDRIADAKALTDAFNPDAKFKALTSSLSGVAGGFAAVQGAMSLLGSESQDVQKMLLKVQSAMAISQGLQSVGESIDSFRQLGAVIKSTTLFQTAYNFVLGKKVVVTEADIIATEAQTVATVEQGVATVTTTTAVTGATTAMKAFRVALIASGIGLLIVAIGLAVQAFSNYVGATSKAEEAQKKLNKQIADGAKVALDAEQHFLEGQEKLDIARAKAKGSSEQQIFEIEQKYRRLRAESHQRHYEEVYGKDAKAAQESSAEINKINIDGQVATLENEARIRKEAKEKREKDAQDKKEARKKEEADEIADREAGIARRKEINDFEVKIQQDLMKLDEDKATKKRELAYQENENLISDIDYKNQLYDFDFEEDQQRLANKEAYLAEQKAIELSNLELTEQQRLEIIGKYAKQEQDIDKDITASKKAEQEARLILQMQLFDTTSAVINGLGSLFQQGTAASKAAAIADIAINTAKGYVQGLDIAQKGAAATGPAAPYSFPIFYATQIAAVLLAVSKARNVLATAKGGGGSSSLGSAPSISTQAPMIPQLPQAQTTNISRQSINDMGNQAVRAYVIETDVTGNQQRMAAIRQRARFS
jgi:hypothetical protein